MAIQQEKSNDNFKIRQSNDTRIEALSDGVFALAIAIILLSSSSPSNYAELLEFVYDIIPFGLSMLFIFWVWKEQKNYFRRFDLHDAKSTNLNLLLLFFVLYYTFPLKFLMSWIINFFTTLFAGQLREKYEELNQVVPFEEVSSLMIIYGLGFIAVFGCLHLLYRHALNKKEELTLSNVEIIETEFLKNQFLFSVGIGFLSVIIAAIGNIFNLAMAAFFSGIVYNLIWIGGMASRKRKDKKLAQLQS